MLIAISTSNSDIFSESPKRYQNAAYATYLKNGGYTPVLIPMEAHPDEIASAMDGLLLSGGVDIDPIYYGNNNNYSFGTDVKRDMYERELIRAFTDLNKPILGICRGFQLLAQEFMRAMLNTEQQTKVKGKNIKWYYEDFIEYVQNVSAHTQTSTLKVNRSNLSHSVSLDQNLLYNGVASGNFDSIFVNSMHHQAVAFNFAYADAMLCWNNKDHTEPIITNFDYISICAYTNRGVTQPKKGNAFDYANLWTIVEAAIFKHTGSRITGVQWHPEELNDIALLNAAFG